MLMHAHNWLITDDSNAAVALEGSYVGLYEALKNLIYRGSTAPLPLTIAMKTVL